MVLLNTKKFNLVSLTDKYRLYDGTDIKDTIAISEFFSEIPWYCHNEFVNLYYSRRKRVFKKRVFKYKE